MMEAELLEASSAAGGAGLAAKVADVDGKVDTLIAQVSSMQDSLGQLLLARGAGVPHARADNEGEALLDEKGEVGRGGRDGNGGRGGFKGNWPLAEPSPRFDEDGVMVRAGEKASGSSESQARTASRSPPMLDPVKTTAMVQYATAPRLPSGWGDGVPQRLPRIRSYDGQWGGSPPRGSRDQETRGRGSHHRGRSSRSREPRRKVKS